MLKSVVTHIRWPVIVIGSIALLMTIQSWYTESNWWFWIGGFLIAILLSSYGLILSHRTANNVELPHKILILMFSVGLIAFAEIIRAFVLHVPIFNHYYREFSFSMLIYNCVIAPFVEETIYRQMFYHEWLAKINLWMGRLIVGFVFVLMHFPTNPATWAFYTIAACSLFITYEGTGNNLKWSISLHLLNNILVLI